MSRPSEKPDLAPQPEPGYPLAAGACELVESLAWIARLRWVAATGVAAAITIARWWLRLPLPVAPLYAVAGGLALYNGGLSIIIRAFRAGAAPSGARREPTAAAVATFANLQLSCDLLFLAALIYFAGGIENPFTSYFIFHVVIASILLSRRATFFQTTLASALVLAMALAQTAELGPHYHLAGVVPAQTHLTPILAYGVTFAVDSTLFLTAYFATSITARLRQREQEIIGLSRSLEEKAADLSLANERLRQTERAKSKYMRRVAHELRSPLATLHTMIGLVLDGHQGEIPPHVRETLTRVRVRLRLLMDVQRDLLALSRAREADLSRAMKAVSIGEVIAALAPDLEQAAREAQVTLDIAAAADLAPVAGERESLAQLVSNLASNAIKYTPAGGWVKIAAQAVEDRVELAVADSGIGIAREEIGHIFDEFYRAENARESAREGTGLGLSIVKAICDSHGAEITVQSEPGKGTTFRVRFQPWSCE
jgi:signal transduction histidine kinase